MENKKDYDYEKSIETVKNDRTMGDLMKEKIIDLILRAKEANVLPVDIMKLDHHERRLKEFKEIPQKISITTTTFNKYILNDLFAMAKKEYLSNEYYRHDDDYLVSKMYVYDKNADLLLTGTPTLVNFEIFMKGIDKSFQDNHEEITKKGFLDSIDYAKEYCAFPVYSIYLVKINNEELKTIRTIIEKYPKIIVRVNYCLS